MNVLVTGATGFVGGFLCDRLLSEGLYVRGTILSSENGSSLVVGVDPVSVGLLGIDTAWNHALAGIEIIIHLAARVHIMEDPSADPLTEFRRVNVNGTVQLAREAAKAGVRRFVFISSIKVNGEESVTPYTSDSTPNPSDPYGISKWEAEQALRGIEAETGMEIVVIRSPLVYGSGVKANFLNMMKIIYRCIPLPLASISNKRSLIYVGNLVDAITVCAIHPLAAGKTYLVSDSDTVSTPELIRLIADALGVAARLFKLPVIFILLAGKLTGKSRVVNRLTGSLIVDSSKIRRELGWTPPFTMKEGVAKTSAGFLNRMI